MRCVLCAAPPPPPQTLFLSTFVCMLKKRTHPLTSFCSNVTRKIKKFLPFFLACTRRMIKMTRMTKLGGLSHTKISLVLPFYVPGWYFWNCVHPHSFIHSFIHRARWLLFQIGVVTLNATRAIRARTEKGSNKIRTTMPPSKKKKTKKATTTTTKKNSQKGGKKGAVENSESDDDEEEEDEEEDEDESDVDGEDDDDKFIDVEIEFVTPREEHFINLKSYLTSYCDGSQYNVSELVDMILKQDNVGSVIASRVSAEEEEDPLGVLTVVSLDKAKEFKCLAEIKAHIAKKAPKEEAKLVRDALNANKTGLILSERLVNVPQDVGGPLVKQLFDEIKWAVKDEKKKEFDFDQYILVSRCFLDTFRPPLSMDATSSGGKKNNNNKRKKDEKEEVTELVFPNLEDEIFYEESQWSFMWEAGGEDKPQEFEDSKPMRMCMLIDAKDVETICKEVQRMFLALSIENEEK